MSEEDKQTATTQTDDQAKSESEGAGAPEKKEDLDTLLAEYEEQTGSAEQKTETKQPDLAAEVNSLRQEIYQGRYRQDMAQAIKNVRGDLDPEVFDDDFVETWLNAQAKKDPRVAQAWMKRDEDPHKYVRVLEGLGRELAKKNIRRHDEKATADREAVAEAVRSHGTKAPEGKPPDLSKMSDNELAAYKESLGM